MSEEHKVIIIGGGHAGLAMSYCLKQRGIDHLVLEKNAIGHAWRNQRWDSFCLVTPNWQCKLPGFDYAGNDPHGFMVRDQVIAYIQDYARSFDPPIREGVEVQKLSHADGKYRLATSDGDLVAEQVVVAIGGYHNAKIPRIAERFPRDIQQLHAAEYRNPESLPEGDVLVVGSGQSGCQIAEDLHLAGRKVHLCVGGAPRVSRRYRGKDVVEWLDKMGYYDLTVHDHPLKEQVRLRANHYVTGRDGGRDIDLRQRAKEGMHLYGRLLDLVGTTLHFKDDVKTRLDKADEVSQNIKTSIDKYIDAHHIDAPAEACYVPVWEPRRNIESIELRQAGIRSVIWCVGYSADFRWIEIPVFDGKGYPGHDRGVTPIPGLYFLGLPWLYTWGSGRLSGVARDAECLADRIGSRVKRPRVQLEAAALGS